MSGAAESGVGRAECVWTDRGIRGVLAALCVRHRNTPLSSDLLVTLSPPGGTRL